MLLISKFRCFFLTIALTAGLSAAVADSQKQWSAIKPVLESGNLESLTALLDKKPELVHAENGYGLTALTYALFEDKPAIVDLLLERGAIPPKVSSNATPPVVMAVCNEREQYFEKLIAAGADPKAQTDSGINQLNCWVRQGRVAKVTQLLDTGWNPRGEPNALPPIFSAVFAKDAALQLLQLLQQRGATLDVLTADEGMGLVDFAVLARRVDLATAFWEQGLRFGNASELIYIIQSESSQRHPVSYAALEFLLSKRDSLTPAQQNQLALLLLANEQTVLATPLLNSLTDISQSDHEGRNIAHYLIARGDYKTLFELLDNAKTRQSKLPDLNAPDTTYRAVSAFALAAGRTSVENLTRLQQYGGSAAEQPSVKATPLLVALYQRRSDNALWLLENGATGAAEPSVERPLALAQALDNRQLDIADYLLKAGQRLSVAPDALQRALKAADQEWLQILLKSGFPIGAGTTIGYGETPLTYLLSNVGDSDSRRFSARDRDAEKQQAERKQRRWLVTQLLAAGADPSEANRSGDNPLTIAISQEDKILASLLLKANAKLPEKLRGYDLENSTRNAIEMGSAPLIDLFLAGYIRFDDRYQRQDWLCIALQNRQLAIAEKLIKAGAKVATTQQQGAGVKCAFDKAGLRLLIKHGADVNVRLFSSYRERPPWLHQALLDQDLDLVKELLAAGADPNFGGQCGRTPLFFAHSAEAVNLLVESGAKVNAYSNDSSTPLVMAVQSDIGSQNEYQGRQSCGVKPTTGVGKIRALCKHGADINSGFDADTNPAIQRAIKSNDIEGFNAILDSCQLDFSGKNCQTCATTDLPLGFATQHKRLDMISKLVAKGAPIDHAARWRPIPLHSAIFTGDEAVVRRLLSLGADPNLLWRGRTALMIAAENKPDLVPLLLEAGADPGIKNHAGETAHALALAKGQQQAAALLLGDRQLSTAEVDTALIAAAQSGELSVVTSMLSKQPSQSAKDKALRGANKLAIVDALLKANANPNAENKDKQRNFTPAIVANAANDLAVIKRLLAGQADINAVNADGDTALLVAAQKSKWETVEYLLSQQADPNITGRHGDSVLRQAVRGEKIELVKKLLKQGANPNSRYWYEGAVLMGPLRNLQYKSKSENAKLLLGLLLAHDADINIAMTAPDDRFIEWTPLMAVSASHKFGLEALEFLLANGADIHARDARGRTAWLWYASSGRERETATALLAAGADPLAVDNDGNNALHAAGDEGWRKGIYEYLMEFGLDINSRNHAGMTPLMSEVYGASGFQYIAHLVELGAEVKAVDNHGRTALWWASAFNPNADFSRRLVPETLVELGADVNRADKDGITPLARAITGFRRANEQLPLLKLGADPNQLVGGKQLPLVVAALFRRVEEKTTPPSDIDIARRLQWVDGLLKNGANINLDVPGVGTPLAQLEAANADERLIQAFIKRGAKP